MDKFHACEHLGPGGVKCSCCGRTATNKTKRTRLKRQLQAEITQALEDTMPAYRCLHCKTVVLSSANISPAACRCGRLHITNQHDVDLQTETPALYIRPGTQYESAPEAP